MKRQDFPQPYDNLRIDLNSEAAYADSNMKQRPYPRLMPVPWNTVCKKSVLTLPAWRKNLTVFPQLYVITGNDIRQKESEGASAGDIAAVGFGLSIIDDGIMLASEGGAPRDLGMCYWYSLYTDDSQVLSDDVYPYKGVENVVLTIESETLGKASYAQKDLQFEPVSLIREAGSIVTFLKNDLITMGASAAPLHVAKDRLFKKGEVIRITAEGLADEPLTLLIPVNDERDPEKFIPSWKPRAFYLGEE